MGLRSSTCRATRCGPAIDRNKGLHNVLDKAKDKYQIVFEQTANFARAEGLSVTEAGLAGKGKPDVIVCANDDMALGAMEAVKARNLSGIAIYGFDALPEALKAIRAGQMAATIEQFPGEQSREAMRIAVSYARDGKKPDTQVKLITPWRSPKRTSTRRNASRKCRSGGRARLQARPADFRRELRHG